jgi:hypothetical protein
MAGTRRGAHGTGRRTRREVRPIERQERLAERLSQLTATPRERVSWASAHLRAVMADPGQDPGRVAQTAAMAVTYLIKLASELEGPQ